MNIIQAMQDENLFAPWFRGDSWKPSRSYLSALFGLPFQDEEAFEIFKRHTGRTVRPGGPFTESIEIVGRRGGKSLLLALIVVFCAVFRDYSAVTVPGESLVAMLLASDKKQAAILLRYVNAFFDQIPILTQMVTGRTAESIVLNNGVTILVATSDYRAVRGFTLIVCACDELAFWASDGSVSPDKEILDAVRPGLSTIPGALLVGGSSPYAKKGVVWEVFRDHYGKDDSPVLVWRAKTRAMNPKVSRAVVAAAYLRDPASARAEYGAEFRADIANFIPEEVVQACVVPGRFELPPVAGVNYFAFTDPSGGSSDSWPTAIVHCEGEKVVVDCLVERIPPFSPESVVKESSDTAKRYGLRETTGDKYGGEFPRELFSKCGVTYKVAEHSRSELYLELLPALMSGRVELLDNKKLVAQLCTLERRTARGGRDSVDHGVNQHDDLANVIAGAMALALAGHSQVLGVVEFEKLEATGQLATLKTTAEPWTKEYLFRFEAKLLGLNPDRLAHPDWNNPPTQNMKSNTVAVDSLRDHQSGCPKCGSTSIRSVGGGGDRCQECGHQFYYRPGPMSFRPARRKPIL